MRKVTGALAAVIFSGILFATTAIGSAADTSKHHSASPHYRTIAGTVMAVNGDLVQFRQDNGVTISLNQNALLRSSDGLIVGDHYSLRGYWSDDLFVARANGPYNAGNGYPSGGTVSIRGVIVSIDASRVTLLQGLFSTVTVDDQQALNNGAAQDLYVGRSVTVYGFWSGPVFYATAIS